MGVVVITALSVVERHKRNCAGRWGEVRNKTIKGLPEQLSQGELKEKVLVY